MRSLTRIAAVAAACLSINASVLAQKKPAAAYNIIDLRSPYHAADGNWSSTSAERISSVDTATALTYISGDYERSSGVRRSCLWAVSGSGSVVVADLDSIIEPSDVNAAGIVGGILNGLPANRPALWHPNFGVLDLLESPDGGGWVAALNDPDEKGEFQAVGFAETLTPPGSSAVQATLWTVTADGEIVSSELIGDGTGADIQLYDINNSGEITGVEYVDGRHAPFVAWFDATDTLQVEYLPNPDPAIVYFRDLQIDDAGNVVGRGAIPQAGGPGEYPRAVVWPAMGPAVSLSTLTGGAGTMGNGVATVGGVMQVAGSAFRSSSSWYATLYSSGKLTDLTKVAKGTEVWSLYEGHGVNGAGLICGRGRVGPSRSVQHHSYVLIPNTPQ